MKAPEHWRNCITHHGDEVAEFVGSYFGAADRRCLLVGGAGFDPRSASVPQLLAGALVDSTNDRLKALFIRERRPNPDADLARRGDDHAEMLSRLVPKSDIADVEVLSSEDGAVVGGHRAVRMLGRSAALNLDELTDVVLDMSALSIGISFPLARYLIDACAQASRCVNFHVLVASHPQLDAAISSVSSDVVDPVRGFSGAIDLAESDQDAKIWLPHLGHGRKAALNLIRQKLQGPVDVCPVLPLSQRDPRAADKLIAEFESELNQEWEVDPRNLVYAIEDDPLDLYRMISAIHRRHKRVFHGVANSHVVLSPSGDKVLAIGALMAALEHDLPVRYVEAVSYSVAWDLVEKAGPETSRLVHVWLHGEPYVETTFAGEAEAGLGARVTPMAEVIK